MKLFLPFVAALFLGIACAHAQGEGGGQRAVIRKLIIEGNNITRSSVILREIGIHEGDSIAVDSIKEITEQNKLRLFNLQLFNEVDQHTTVYKNSVDWYISVKERWFIIPSATVQFADRNFNTWWVQQHHDLRRAMAGLTVTDKNFRGNLEALAITVQAGYTQRLAVSYLRPYWDKGQVSGVGFWASAAQSRQTYYATDSDKLLYVGTYTGPVISSQLEGGLTYVYRPRYASRHIFQLNYHGYNVSDTVVKLNPGFFLHQQEHARFAELFYRYEYNGVDNWNYSLKGFKLVTNAAVRQGQKGVDFQSFVNVEAGIFSNLHGKWYGAAVFRGRVMYLQDQPYFFRGGLGTQTDYVRGYEYYIIDGGNYGLIRLDLKREIFNNTYSIPIKYFTAIPVRIYPKIFVDAGYINSPQPGNNFLANQLLYSVGAGVDIITLYDIKFRLEVAYNHLKQNGLYLHTNSE
jgi:outer membrane protein assembly factor BamA